MKVYRSQILLVLIFPMAGALAHSPRAQASVELLSEPFHLATELTSKIRAPLLGEACGPLMSNVAEDPDVLDKKMRCGQVAEVPGAYLCETFSMEHLNLAFTRIGFFMGASREYAAGTLVPHSDIRLRSMAKLVAGHNMPGRTILAFFEAALKHPDESALGLNAYEREFYETVVQGGGLAKDDAFYVIGFSHISAKPFRKVITHEIWHALYYLDPRFKAIIDEFWRARVSDEDKSAVRAKLDAMGYNSSDEIVIDEFQAYLLQEDALLDHFRQWVAQYRPRLRARLTRAGYAAIKVQK